MSESMDIIQYLTEFGWYKGRRIDTALFRKKCEDAGHRWNVSAEEFLTEFGGLRLPAPYTRKENIKPPSPVLDFTLSSSTGFGTYGRDFLADKVLTIEDFEELLGTRLCPIGDYNHGWNVLFAGDDHYYTFLENGAVIKMGTTSIEVIQSYLDGITGEEVL